MSYIEVHRPQGVSHFYSHLKHKEYAVIILVISCTGRHGFPNHWLLDWLFNSLFRLSNREATQLGISISWLMMAENHRWKTESGLVEESNYDISKFYIFSKLVRKKNTYLGNLAVKQSPTGDGQRVYRNAALTHWGQNKMDAISQTTFWSAFSWMKKFEFRITLKFVPMAPINNNPRLVQVLAWRRPGDKPLSEPMMVRLQITDVYIRRSAPMS